MSDFWALPFANVQSNSNTKHVANDRSHYITNRLAIVLTERCARSDFVSHKYSIRSADPAADRAANESANATTHLSTDTAAIDAAYVTAYNPHA